MSPARPILNLWPTGNPDAWSRSDQETTERDQEQGFDLVKNVSKPTLEVFLATHPKPHAPTVIICPGGGYFVEAIEHEGREIAERLNREGFNAAVLKYRLPNRDADKPLHKAPLQDAQRAVRLLRSRATEYNIDPARVGIMGFSAGGHLAAAASTAKVSTYASVDAADELSFKPAFTVLVYPAYLDVDGRPELPSDVQVTKETPPAFVVQTMDDRKLVPSSFAYALALQRAEVPAELHLFPKGGHGYGLRSKEPGISGWMELLMAWLGRLA
ncbi:alpha/beta hydrolase [bacterium]|nr:MAG: alpha/beta hydrolase [bacterium]